VNYIKFSVAWGRMFFRTLHREAALDSLRNVLALIGAGTILADFSTMRYWFIVPGSALLFLIWFADYRRHFDGETSEESCAQELKGGL
jgi:hypothetical protein